MAMNKELLHDLSALSILIEENPCGMKNGLIKSLADVVRGIIIQRCTEGASREQVARYLKRDVRTIARWQNMYDDFPERKHCGHKEVSYNWLDVVKWKKNHSELFEES